LRKEIADLEENKKQAMAQLERIGEEEERVGLEEQR
jgi:hypothetical protein